MPSPAESKGPVPPQASPLTVLEDSRLALARRLENTAQVLAAWAGVPDDDADLDDLRTSLRDAAVRIEQAVGLLQGEEVEPVDSASPEGAADEEEADDDSGLRGRSDGIMTLVDLVSFLSHLGRSGVLEVSTGKESFLLEFRQGAIVFATGDLPKGLRLGDLLLEQEALEEEDLELALEECKKGEVLGDALLRLELISEKQLGEALNLQMSQLFGRIHEVGTGFDFRFQEGRQMLEQSHARLSTSHLLLEGARLLDEGAVRGLEKKDDEPESEEEEDGGLDGELDLGASWLGDIPEDEGELDVESFRAFVEVLFLEESLSLPCLPESTAQLLHLCCSEKVNLGRLTAELGRDPAVCAHVLRAAGSDEVKPDREVTSFHSAVYVLGPARLRELALSLTLNGRAFGLGAWREAIGDLWRSAELAGDFGALIGRSRLENEGLGRFLAQMQDIGKPIVLGAIHDIEQECRVRLAPSAAKQVMEEFHERTGVWLARKFGFPETLARVIEHHHSYHMLQGQARREAQVALMAHELACAVMSPASPDPEAHANLQVAVALDCEVDEVERLIEEQGKRMAAAVSAG